jgi:O-antigen/teichoic acid export membrane protein
MNRNLSKLFKDTSIYGTGSVLTKIISFLLLPVYTHYLTPADYGVLESTRVCTGLLILIFTLGIPSGMLRYFYIADNQAEKGKVIFTALSLVVISTGIILIPAIFFSRSISQILFKTTMYYWVVLLSLLGIMIIPIQNLVEQVYQMYRQPKKYLVLMILRAIVNPLLTILFVVIIEMGVLGAQLSTTLGTVILLCFAYFYFTRRKLTFSFSWKWAKKMFIYGIPMIGGGLAYWIYDVSDRFFILHYKNLSEIGYYSIGNSFALPVAFLNQALIMALSPMMLMTYESEKDPDKPETKLFLISAWKTYLLIALSVTICLSFFSEELLKIATTKAYLPAVALIPIICFISIFSQSSQMIGGGMALKEKSLPYMWIMIISAAINIILNFLFIPKIGVMGAVLATLITQLIYLIVVSYLSQRIFRVHYNFVKNSLYIVLSLLISIVFPFLFIYEGISFHLVTKVAFIIVIIPFLPISLRIIRFDDIKEGFIIIANYLKQFYPGK